MYEYQIDFFFRNAFCLFILRPRVFFLALSAAGHAGGSRVNHGESVGPGRAPWRMLWALKVAKSGDQLPGGLPPS